VELEVVEVGRDERGPFARAEASLWADGIRIYHARALGMRVVAGASPIECLDPAADTWLADHRPTFTIPALPLMCMVDRLAAAAGRSAPGRRVVGLRDVQVKRWVTFDRGAVRLKTEAVPAPDGSSVEASLQVWRQAATEALSRFESVLTGTVLLDDEYPPPPPPLDPLLDGQVVADPYGSGDLFHGPSFHVLRRLEMGSYGSAAVIDASAGGVPVGVLNQALLDGATHAIPHATLERWSARIPADRLAYPYRIIEMSLHGPPPVAGLVGCEVRFEGTDEDTRFPVFRIQLLAEGRVWLAMRLVEILLPSGPLGSASPERRRVFLERRGFVPGLALSRVQGRTTRLTPAELKAIDWLPGTVATAYQARGELETLTRVVAIKDHVARLAEVHPAQVDVSEDHRTAVAANLPLTRYPVDVRQEAGEVVVADAASASLDTSVVRAYWRRRLHVGSWLIEDLYFGLAERFVGRVVLSDPAAFHRLRGRSALFLANHQVGIESLIFSTLVSGLMEGVTVALAKVEHRGTWLGRLMAKAFAYPGLRDPGTIIFFDRQDQRSLLEILEAVKAQMTGEGKSALVHVEGTRALAANRPVRTISSVWVDLSLASGVPIVPVRFAGGLPRSEAGARLEFPVGFGRQDYYVGRPIPAEELAPLSLAERRERVQAAINELGPEAEAPSEGDPAFAAAVEEWRRRTGSTAEAAVLFEALAHHARPGPETRALLEGAQEGRLVVPDDPRGRWLAEMARDLYGDRGPRVAVAGPRR